MKAQTIKKNSQESLEEKILEKKSVHFNFKNFYSAHSEDYSPYLQKNNKDKHSYFQDISLSMKMNILNIFKPDKFAKQKKELNSVFRKLIAQENYKDMNDFLEQGFVPDINNYHLLANKVDRSTGEYALLPLIKEKPLYGVLAQFLFVNSHFQIYCNKILLKIQEHFPQEHLSADLIKQLHSSGKPYKDLPLSTLSYDKEHLVAAINMHNLCLNPKFAIPMFSHALKRIANHDKYSYISAEWSVGAVLKSLYTYVEPHLSVEDISFIKTFLKKQKDKIYKQGGNMELYNAVNDFYDTIDIAYQLDASENTDSIDNDKKHLLDQKDYKEQLLCQVKHIYGNDNQKNLSVPQHVAPLVIDQKQFLPQHTHIINKIKSIHNALAGAENLLGNDMIEQINKVVSETLPLTIEKYHSINVDFRDKIKNVEGKNAHELLEESLSNILVIMKDAEIQLEQAKVNEFSLINRKNKII